MAPALRRLQEQEDVFGDPDFGVGIGIGLGSTVGLLLLGAVLFMCYERCRRQRSGSNAPTSSSSGFASASVGKRASGIQKPGAPGPSDATSSLSAAAAAMKMDREQAPASAGTGFAAQNPLRGKAPLTQRRGDGFGLKTSRKSLTGGLGAPPPGIAAGRAGAGASAAGPGPQPGAAREESATTVMDGERKVIQIGSQRVLASSLSIGTLPAASGAPPSAQEKLAAAKAASGGESWRSNPTSAVAAVADASAPVGGLAAAGHRASSKQQWATGTGPRRLTRAPSNVNRILKPPQLAGDSDSSDDEDLLAASDRADKSHGST
jgi:hypothetical protein